VNNQLNDVEKRISESGSNIDSSKGNVEKGSANLKDNHEAARKAQEQGMDNEITRQKSLAGIGQDELTEMAINEQKKE